MNDLYSMAVGLLDDLLLNDVIFLVVNKLMKPSVAAWIDL